MRKLPAFLVSPSGKIVRVLTSASGSHARYWFSACTVIFTLLFIALGKIIFGSLPLVLFAAAIVTASKCAGIGGGIISVVLSTLACDFFFLPPIFAINFDQTTWTLAAKYGSIALLSCIILRQKRREVAPTARPVRARFGYLDGVAEGEVFGWAIDPDHPAEPARITAHINDRPVAEALAVYYRQDVAQKLHSSGSHGFFVNLSQICDIEMDASVDVRLSSGKSLEGSPIQARLPCRTWPPAPTLLFMHIPKTAGTALRETARRNYKRSEIAYIYPQPPGFPLRNLRDLPLSQRAQFRFVVGHFQYGIHSEIPNDCWYFTIVRNPIGRVWSHYQYLVEFKDPVVVSNDHVKSLQELLEGRLTANLDNLMVRCFAGVSEGNFPPGLIDRGVYELAVHHLEDAFGYVGHQERLSEAYSFLQRKLGWNSSAPPDTLNRGSYFSGEQMDNAKAELIGRFNTWDIKLYEQILGMFP